MTLFAIAFLLIYSLMHLLVWWGVRPIVPAGRRPRIAAIIRALQATAAPAAGDRRCASSRRQRSP